MPAYHHPDSRAIRVEMDDARRGITFYLGHCRAEQVFNVQVDVIGAHLQPIPDFVDMIKAKLIDPVGQVVIHGAAAVGDYAAVNVLSPTVRELYAGAKKLICDFFRSLHQRIVKFLEPVGDEVNWLANYVNFCIAELLNVFSKNLSALTPGVVIAQGVGEMLKGLERGIQNCWTLYNHRHAGLGGDLMEGHPTTIAKALKRHLQCGALGGLRDIAVGGLKMGLTLASNAWAPLASALIGGVQLLMQYICLKVQRDRLDTVFAEARSMWERSRTLDVVQRLERGRAARGEASRTIHDPMTHREKAFHVWFRRACGVTPIVAALAVTSGYCAHPMRFLRLLENFEDKSARERWLAGHTYASGVRDITMVKDLSLNYIKSYTSEFRTKFSSDNQQVNAILSQVQNGQPIRRCWTEKIITPLVTTRV